MATKGLWKDHKAYYWENRERIQQNAKRSYQNNKEKNQKRSNKYYKENRDFIVLKRRAKLYNVGVDYLKEMLIEQDKKCLICGEKFDDTNKHTNWAVDHCHTTNRVRGLIHNKCNLAIGGLKDSPVLLQNAVNYVSGEQYGPLLEEMEAKNGQRY